MSAFNPVPAGGVEPSVTEMIETWIEMAWRDGSFGWVGIANLPSSFTAACYLPDAGFADVFTGTQHAFISEKVAVDAAQIWLGLIEDQPGL
jgi:hypothetical protein